MFELAELNPVRPVRLTMVEGIDLILELLLVQDSSGKVAAHLMFSEQSRKAVNILTLMQVPQILLDMRTERDPAWLMLEGLARDLCEDAVFLLKTHQYNDDDV